MPNKEAIRAWVEDLRSGSFKQGKNVLRHMDEYCCMGVACETHKKATGGLYDWVDADESGIFAYAREDQLLPQVVADWLGFPTTDPYVQEDDSCSTVNDVLGWDFNRIADAIERTYLLEA